MCDRSHKPAEPAVVAAQFEDLLDDCPILAFQLADLSRRRNDVRTFLDIYSEAAVRVSLSRTGYSSMETIERDGKSTSWKVDAFGHFRNYSNLCVCVAVPRHQENMLVSAGVQRQCDGHPGENHRVIQRNECKPCHKTNDMHIVDIVNY